MRSSLARQSVWLCVLALMLVFPVEAWAKYSICTITINSNNEACLFSKKLKPKSDFEFHELVPGQSADPCAEPSSTSAVVRERPGTDASKDNGDWFEKECVRLKKAKLHCDVLIISGHFGGTFFGSSGKKLTLETLEQMGCNNVCPGIMNSPKEVFLFGCNTLAGKGTDNRTPEQYRTVLRSERNSAGERLFTDSQIEEIVAFRYSEFGQSNKERMTRAFSEIPHIYGFDSIAPSGKKVEPALKKYLNLIPDYARHLKNIEDTHAARGMLLALDEVQKRNETKAMAKPNPSSNTPIAEAFKKTNFEECAGAPGEDSNEFCSLFDETRPLATRLISLKLLLTAPKGAKYLALAKQFFERHPPENYDEQAKKRFQEIVQDSIIRERFTLTLTTIEKMPDLALALIDLGEKTTFITPENANNRRKQILSTLINEGTIQAKDTICGRNDWPEIDGSDLPLSVFSNTYSLQALECIETTQRLGANATKVLMRTLTSSKEDNRRIAVWLLGMDRTDSPDAYLALAKMLEDKNPTIREMAAWALQKARSPQSQALPRLISALEGKDRTVKQDVIVAMSRVKPIDALSRAALENVRKHSDKDVVRLASRVLTNNFSPIEPPTLVTAKAQPIGQCKELDRKKIDDNTVCTTSKGVVFARVRSSAGQTGWRDSLTGIVWFDETNTGINHHESEMFCREKAGQALPSGTELKFAEKHGFREVFENSKSDRPYLFWSSTVTPGDASIAYVLDGSNGRFTAHYRDLDVSRIIVHCVQR